MNAIDHLRSVRQASAADIAEAIGLPIEHAYAQLVAAESRGAVFVDWKWVDGRSVRWWRHRPVEFSQDGRLAA